MQRLAGRAIFSVGERVFAWEDVVLVAYLRGEIAKLERAIAYAAACERHLGATGDARSDDDLDEATDRWRYERNLLSADDTEAWLTERHVGLDEWLAYVRRTESARWCAERAITPARSARLSRAEIASVLFAEAMSSGSIASVVEELAGCAAVVDRASTLKRAPRSATTSKAGASIDGLPADVRRGGLFSLTGAETTRRAKDLVALKAEFERTISAFATRPALEREIDGHGVDWTRFALRTLVFDTDQAAREAALLVREDGLPIAQAAKLAGRSVQHADVVLDDLAPVARDHLIGAQRGDLVGPLELDAGFVVAYVADRIVPTAADVHTRERAREEIIRRAVGAEIDERVRWHERF